VESKHQLRVVEAPGTQRGHSVTAPEPRDPAPSAVRGAVSTLTAPLVFLEDQPPRVVSTFYLPPLWGSRALYVVAVTLGRSWLTCERLRLPRNSPSAYSPPNNDMTTLPKVDTNCTVLSLIPTVNGNTVRSFSTHGHQSAAKGSLTTVSRSDIR
jgi:hypothetical protein